MRLTTRDVQTGMMSEYSLDNAWALARERLAALEERHDAATIRHLEALGVGDGWHCLEIGGGGGSITEWLCRRVGPTGRVVATDINPRFLEVLDSENLEVRAHNIVEDELEQSVFDLVHTRGVLVNLSRRATALERMVSALKPGGVLMVEETDYSSSVADPRAGEPRAILWLRALSASQVASGIDSNYGRRPLR